MRDEMTRDEFLKRFEGRNIQALGLVYDHAKPKGERFNAEAGHFEDYEQPFQHVIDRLHSYRRWLSIEPSANFWLTPKGLAYNIGYTHHSSFLYAIGLDYQQAETGGWIHVSDNRADILHRPTAAQLRVLDSRPEIKWDIETPAGDFTLLKPVLAELVTPFNARPAYVPRTLEAASASL